MGIPMYGQNHEGNRLDNAGDGGLLINNDSRHNIFLYGLE